MLIDVRATALHFDPSSNAVEVVTAALGASAAPADGPTDVGDVACRVLLDAAGHLVGIALDGNGAREVVMLGRHEDVATTRDAVARVTRRAGSVAIVRIGDARALRAHETSPYL